MRHFTLRALALAVALAAGTGSALAQEVTLRLHQFLPAQANVPKHILDPWADKVEKEFRRPHQDRALPGHAARRQAAAS